MMIIDREGLETKCHRRTGKEVPEQERAEVGSAVTEDDSWEDDIRGQI